MTTTIPDQPQPPAEEYRGEDQGLWDEYNSAIQVWNMRYKWLPQVLNEPELAEAQALDSEDLFEKYMAVADGGPLGGVWYNQLIAMRELLQRNRFKPWVQRRFLDDYIQTHNLDGYPAWPEGQKPTLGDRAGEAGLIGGYWPDVDSYFENTVIGHFFDYRPVWHHFRRLQKRGVRVESHYIGEIHSWTTSLVEVLAEFPHFNALREAHDEFVTRWSLPTENVPDAAVRDPHYKPLARAH